MQKLYQILTKNRVKFEVVALVCIWLGFSVLLYIVFAQKRIIASRYEPVIITQKSICPQCDACDDVSPVKYLSVDIGGAVWNPGVYQVPVGSLLTDLVQKAGGLRTDLVEPYYLQKRLNLAQLLSDNQKYYIPYRGENWQIEAAIANDDSALKTTDGSAVLINVNTATLKQLTSLNGIGEVRAQAIIDNRPYESLSDLVTSGALTETIFAKIEGLVTF